MGVEIPTEVRALLRNHIVSFEQLQVLLLLHSGSQEPWSVDAISNALHIDSALVAAALDALQAIRLVNREPAHRKSPVRYAPDAPLSPAVDALAQSFESHRAAIMSIMSTNAIERVRSGAIRAFSDSFVIKKKDSDG
jgi:hypothetical protein